MFCRGRDLTFNIDARLRKINKEEELYPVSHNDSDIKKKSKRIKKYK